jgi:hypothetical protein
MDLVIILFFALQVALGLIALAKAQDASEARKAKRKAEEIERHKEQVRRIRRDFDRAYAAAKAKATPPWWQSVLGVSQKPTENEIAKAYRAKALLAHPDLGGNHESMTRLNRAKDAALKTMGYSS